METLVGEKIVFAIAVKQDNYQTYILEDNQSHARLEVVPERGGIITKWRIQGQSLLYLDEERFADPTMSIRGGIPILFPICGDLPDDAFYYRGQEYKIKRHGFARDLPWEVVNTATETGAEITLKLESNDQTRAVYPFEFQLQFTYILKGNTLTIKQEFSNDSQEIIPFSVGLHPYFWIGDKSNLELDIPASQYLDQISQKIHPYTGSFDFEEDEIDVALFPLSRHFASATNSQQKLKLNLTFSELYANLVFWTVKGKEYYCLEPWTARRNALNTGEQITLLEPGQSCQAEVELQALHT